MGFEQGLCERVINLHRNLDEARLDSRRSRSPRDIDTGEDDLSDQPGQVVMNRAKIPLAGDPGSSVSAGDSSRPPQAGDDAGNDEKGL